MKTKTLGNVLFVFFFVLTFALVFVFSDANATKPKPPKHPTQVQNQHQNANSESHSEAHVDVVATSGDAISTQSANQSVNVAGDMAAASTAYAAGAYTNMECGATASASKQEVSEGFSLSSIIPWWASRQIRDCWRRDNANWMDSMGLHDEAIASRCDTRAMLIQYKTKEACYDTLMSKLRVRQSLEQELAQTKRDLEAKTIIIQERDKQAQRLKEEVAEKRFVEAVSK